MTLSSIMEEFLELVASGKIALPCGAQTTLDAEIETAASSIEGGPGADQDVFDNPGCCLHPGHAGLHYGIVRSLTAGAVWVRWRGPVSELVVLDDCLYALNDSMDICTLFEGHKGPHR